MYIVTDPRETLPVAEQILSLQGEKLLKVLSDSYARGDGYALEFSAEPQASTFATSCSLDEQGTIKVHLSTELLRRAQAEDRLELLGFATLHELGHVKRFQAEPPKAPLDGKDGYFTNIVDDIAINYGNARRTRFVHDMTKRAYDDYLFPVAKRPELAQGPRHKQFMESLLVLAMTTDAHSSADVPRLLEQANLQDIDAAVSTAINDVLARQQGNKSYNLLGQLRAYGDDLAYTAQVGRVIREHFDALYEVDQTEQQQSSGEGKSQANSNSSTSENESYDYSDSASCGHGTAHTDTTQSKPKDKPSKQDDSSTSEDKNGGEDSIPQDPLDVSSIAEEIANKINTILPDVKSPGQDVPRDFTPEQLAKLKAELNLNDKDFAGYMATRQKYAIEIQAVQDVLLQLRHERQNEFLAPGREVAARGHRIKVNKLVRAVAGAALSEQPDIWKHPSMAERVDYEFDGLDLYLLCDVSGSMQGSKAEAAAASAVVLQEGLVGASAQMAGEHTPIVRLQVQAFGAGNTVLCSLTDEPSLQDFGRTYAALSNPTSGSTQVTGALSAITPEPNRLSVVAVVSDGAFHDSSLARQAGQKLADQNAAIIQMVFGGAHVAELADSAKRINLTSARELPQHLLNMLPELLNIIRTNTHA